MYQSESVSYRGFTFFSPLDIGLSILGAVILFMFIYTKRQRNIDIDYYKYLIPAFLFKVLFALINTLFYIIVYEGGGDSIYYFEAALKLNNLFWVNTYGYFQELFQSPEVRDLYKNFNIETGYPPRWIYDEEEGFFISKIASVFAFFTFKSYILMSLIFAYITTLASWRLFEMIRSYRLHSDWHTALAVFFIPSLSFWCAGVSKDTVVFVSVCFLLYNLNKIISLNKDSSFRNWLVIFICIFVLLQVRSFMIITVFVPLALAYSARLTKKLHDQPFQRNAIKFLFGVAGFTVIVLFFQSEQAQEFATEASVISQDMATNPNYGTNRYDLGITDYSPAGMVKALPVSIIAGFFRPYIWEALSVSLILNGIESVMLFYFTFRFIANKNIFIRLKRIVSNEFLVFALYFSIILAYFAGFTSILFGVLVRFKAPVLPFLLLVLTAHYIDEKRKLPED